MRLPFCACGGTPHFHCDDYIQGHIVLEPDWYVECTSPGRYAQTPKSKSAEVARASWCAMVGAFDTREPKNGD